MSVFLYGWDGWVMLQISKFQKKNQTVVGLFGHCSVSHDYFHYQFIWPLFFQLTNSFFGLRTMTFFLTMVNLVFCFLFIFVFPHCLSTEREIEGKKRMLLTCCVDSFHVCDIFYRYIDTETLVQLVWYRYDRPQRIFRSISGKNKYVRLSVSRWCDTYGLAWDPSWAALLKPAVWLL